MHPFFERSDDCIIQSIRDGSIPDEVLLPEDCWTRIHQLIASGGVWQKLPEVQLHRADLFCRQPDDVILAAIRERTIGSDLLVDKQCWKRICQVRGRNPIEIDRARWKAICEERGTAGPPSGPYE